MDELDWLAKRFEEHRAHMRAVAYRMLGSPSEADDAVQEAWLRLARSDAFLGRARAARPALVDGAVWAPGGRPRVVFGFAVTGGKIVEIELVADPAPEPARPDGARRLRRPGRRKWHSSSRVAAKSPRVGLSSFPVPSVVV